MARYFAPKSLRETLEILQSENVRILAGGTDFYPALQDRQVTFDTIQLGRVAELNGIQKTDEGWRIGATTSWSDIVGEPLPNYFDCLKSAALEVGSIQIQNAGTVAGNLCNASPAADGVPPLLALDAKIEVQSASGTRILPVSDFITGVRSTALEPGEIVSAILIPNHSDLAHSSFRKLGTRSYLVISIAMVAVVLHPGEDGKIAQAGIAVGSCSPVAQRLPALEAALIGAPLEADHLAELVLAEHLAPLSPIDDIRASAEYRLDAVLELLRRGLKDCCKGYDA